MLLLVPMDGDNLQESKLVGNLSALKWALINVEEGKVKDISFYDNKEDITEWYEAVVVIGDYEPVMEFIEMQVMVLVAHTQRTVDEIVEAFLFKELHDLAVM